VGASAVLADGHSACDCEILAGECGGGLLVGRDVWLVGVFVLVLVFFLFYGVYGGEDGSVFGVGGLAALAAECVLVLVVPVDVDEDSVFDLARLLVERLEG
jgi:hypothetical protein